MNKRQIKKNKQMVVQAAPVREITYQEAWNKVSEFMKKDGFKVFFVDSYTVGKCKLRTIENGEYVYHLIEE